VIEVENSRRVHEYIRQRGGPTMEGFTSHGRDLDFIESEMEALNRE